MKRLVGLVALVGLAGLLAPPLSPPAAAAAGEVLILGSTVSGGAGSTLAQKFVLAGKTPVVVSDATWSAMTAPQFDAYDAIVLGDPSCSGTTPAAAVANAATWSSVVDGNVLIIGTDETFHQSQGGAQLMESGAAFSVAMAGKTGAYISLSCYYHGTAPNTPIPLLSGFGTFTATGVGCFNDAHIVATHPALTGLTDASLSNWSCSVHEGLDSWPTATYTVLAIAEGIGGSYTAGDGSVGTPYIVAKGVTAIGDLPECAETAPVPAGYQLVTGTAGNDTINGTSGKELIRALGGNDIVRAYSSNDIVCGGDGNDTVYAGSGDDAVSGGAGNDTLYGESGNDTLYGRAGTDWLDGSAGTDRGIDADADTTRVGIEQTT